MDRYEDVRRRLQERGYLEGPLERFVLRDLVGPGSAIARLVRSDLKAALLGAPVLAALLAAAVVLANRPLLGASDAALLWLYFVPVAGAALFALDLAAALLLAGLARRRGARPTDASRAALIVGIPTLVYLAALGAAHARASLWVDVAFLAAAVAATLLVAWLAGLVSLAGIIGRTGEVPDRRRRPLTVIVLASVALAGAGLVFRLARADDAATAASPFTLAPRQGTLLVVGIDGLDAELLDSADARGPLEGLGHAIERGAAWPTRRPAGLEPPEVWTTLLTGVDATAHGVRTVGSERVPGIATPLQGRGGPVAVSAALRFLLPTRTVPTSGVARRVRTAWEILALQRRVAAVGWWASWPASSPEIEASGSYVLSDRVLPKLLAGRDNDHDVAPPALWTRLARALPEDRAALEDEFARVLALDRAGALGRLAWESFLIDGHAWRVSSRLLQDPELGAAFVYLPGLDILRVRLARRDATSGAGERLLARAALTRYVRWLDGLLAGALRDPARRAVVIADPGRTATPRSEGFVVAVGAPARAGCAGPLLGPLDAALLVLHMAGVPPSREMPGRLPDDCIGLAGRSRVSSYGRREVPAGPAAREEDAAVLERLRSLGYL